MENIKKWLEDWFVSNSAVAKEDLDEEKNYVENEWIDSFQFLNLISDIETEFQISFVDEDFDKEDIMVMKGLLEIISSKL